MSLFERIKEKRINLNEQTFSDRQKSDMRKLLNKNFGSKEKSKKTAVTQKQLAKDNKKMFDVTGKSAVRDAKNYASGEYPKIGGGTRMDPKSKGGGATTGGAKTVYQSDISKQAKKFTKKINKKNINRPEGVIGDTYVSTDKKGNIRSAKRVNPTLKKSVSQVKADIEFKQSLKKAGASGDVSDTAPKKISDYVKKVRDKRIKDLKLPDTSFDAKTKFSQKQFDKSIGGAKKPTSAAAPGLFGKGDTKGQMNVKGMEKKAFKITKPSDVKLPKSFRDFQRNLQDYKDRDVPGGPKKYKQTELKFSSKKTTKPSGSRFDPDIGMAPPDKPKTKGVKQSEVSKKAKDFTKNINQKRSKKSLP